MLRYRPLDWPRDRARLAALDFSFGTAAVYDVTAGPLSFALAERAVEPPLEKRYDVDWGALAAAPLAVVAEAEGGPVGLVAVALSEWNRRAVVSDLYVDRAARGRGAGAGLLRAVAGPARALGARCLWAETQNVNAPAVRFYLRQGFAWCGLDAALYDPARAPGETALFFALALGA